jgi:hypothetical protein
MLVNYEPISTTTINLLLRRTLQLQQFYWALMNCHYLSRSFLYNNQFYFMQRARSVKQRFGEKFLCVVCSFFA